MGLGLSRFFVKCVTVIQGAVFCLESVCACSRVLPAFYSPFDLRSIPAIDFGVDSS